MDQSEHEETVVGKAYDARLMGRLIGYIRPYRRSALFAFLLIVAGSALGVLPPYLTKVAIDRYIASGDLAGIGGIAGLYVTVLAATFGLSFAQTWTMNLMGQRIMYDMRMQVFRSLQRADVAFFDRNPVGRLMTRVTTDVDALNELFTSGVITVFGDLFSLAGIIIMLFLLSPPLALVILSVVPLLFLITLLFKIKVRDSFRRVRAAIARINAFLQENLTGTAVIQLFRQEGRQYGKFQTINREHLDANLQSIFYYSVFYPLLELVGALAVALVIWYGGLRVADGLLTLGALVAFVQYSDRFFRPISDLSEKYTILQSAMAASERIFRLLDTQPAVRTPALPTRTAVGEGRIEFRNVTFAYNPGETVLHGVSFHVEPGERVALVGATGAGKSSILGLLNRFYDVGEGQVLVDGVDVREYDLGSLRRSIGIVLQDLFLFSGTIAENIRLWDASISPERVQDAARTVHAHGFIERLDGGYGARVGERGATLSVGQRQLLAFARALARDPKILILDEATSSIDTETEMLIRDALTRLMAGRTSLIVAHRLSTIQNADRIIVMHRGRIRETGTHQELLRLQGIYWRLYQLQYKDQLAEGAPAGGEPRVLGTARG